MTSAENIHPDMVIRARVKLLGVDRLPHEERVAAYRLLTRVEPRHLPRLVRYLLLWNEKGALTPPLRMAILAEAVSAARRIPLSDPERPPLLHAALVACEHLDAYGVTQPMDM